MGTAVRSTSRSPSPPAAPRSNVEEPTRLAGHHWSSASVEQEKKGLTAAVNTMLTVTRNNHTMKNGGLMPGEQHREDQTCPPNPNHHSLKFSSGLKVPSMPAFHVQALGMKTLPLPMEEQALPAPTKGREISLSQRQEGRINCDLCNKAWLCKLLVHQSTLLPN